YVTSRAFGPVDAGRLLRAAGLPGPQRERLAAGPAIDLLEHLGARWYRTACELAPVRTARLAVAGDVADRFRQARRVLNHLAARCQQRWLEHNPFAATMYGIGGYDHLLPDESEAGEQAWRAEAGRFGAEADAITAATPAEAVTLGCVRGAAAHEQDGIDMAAAEHTVTAMQFAGPATFLAVAARTVLVDPEAAEAYLTRLGGSGTWFSQLGERLRTGAAKGRLPVAPLAEGAVAWAQDVLPGLGPVFAPQPPPGWVRA